MTVTRRRRKLPNDAPGRGDATPPQALPAPGVTRLDPGPPARKVILPAEALAVELLGVGELLDIAEKLGTDLDGVAGLMRAGGVARARFLIALAWVIARRSEPGVTWDDAQRWRIDVETGPAPNPTPPPAHENGHGG